MQGDLPAAVKEADMGEVWIDRAKFLGHYISTQKPWHEYLEHALFVLGLIATCVAPQVVYCASDGPVSPSNFIDIAQAGVILGLVKCLWPTTTIPSIVETQTTSASKDDRTRRRRRKLSYWKQF